MDTPEFRLGPLVDADVWAKSLNDKDLLERLTGTASEEDRERIRMAVTHEVKRRYERMRWKLDSIDKLVRQPAVPLDNDIG